MIRPDTQKGAPKRPRRRPPWELPAWRRLRKLAEWARPFVMIVSGMVATIYTIGLMFGWW